MQSLSSSLPHSLDSGDIQRQVVARAPTRTDDSPLFALFASLAREAGRDDLHAEFTRRAQASTPSPTPVPAPQSEAERHQQLGCRLIREGKAAESLTEFREAIKLDPRHADAHGNLGVALAQLRKLPEAEAAFRLSIRLDPANTTMYVNLATCLHQQGRHPETEEWARQAIQLDPELPEPHRLLGCSVTARRITFGDYWFQPRERSRLCGQ